MSELVKGTLARAKAHPVVATVVIPTSILIGLANAGTAFETLTAFWNRWTQPAPVLDTTWQGVWEKPDGHVFDFVMQLTISSNDSASGRIRWHLLRAPPGSFVEDRIDDEALEFVSGTYNRDARVVEATGTSVSDPTLLAIDDYKFQIRDDNVSFTAMTRASGDRWDAKADGRVLIVPRRK